MRATIALTSRSSGPATARDCTCALVSSAGCASAGAALRTEARRQCCNATRRAKHGRFCIVRLPTFRLRGLERLRRDLAVARLRFRASGGGRQLLPEYLEQIVHRHLRLHRRQLLDDVPLELGVGFLTCQRDEGLGVALDEQRL